MATGLHPQAASLLDMLATLGDTPFEAQTPAEARSLRADRRLPSTTAVEQVWDLSPAHTGLEVALRCYQPRPDHITGATVYLHGGGWVVGDLDSHDEVCRSIAARSGHAVISVDYRLAPEHPFPAGLGDAIAATRWVHANADSLGVDATRLVLAGDSAGANLAAVVAHLDLVPLRHQVLLYPVTDARGGTPSYLRCGEGRFLTAAAMAWFVEHYLAGDHGHINDPRVSPLLAPDTALAASPATLVITAGEDPLCDEGDAYAQRLQAVGVPTSLVRFDGMIHGFVSLAGFLDDGRRALALIGQTIADALDH